MPKITNHNVFMKGKPPKSSKGFYHLYSPILYISHKVSNLMIHKIKPEVLQDFQFRKKAERLLSREQYSEAKRAVLKS